MKEIPVSFKNGKYKVYGELVLPKNKIDSAVIMAHGLTGNIHEHHIFNASRKLAEEGFAVLKISFYDGQKDARKLKDHTLAEEVSDLEAAVNFLKSKGYKKVGMVGHSMGGMAALILASTSDVPDAIVTWEPSNRLGRMFRKWDIVVVPKKGNYASIDWGVEFTLSKKLLAEWEKLGDISPILKSITVPVMIISAGKSVLKPDAKKFYRVLKSRKELKIIEGADHGFNSYEHEDKLIKYTVDWFNKWLK